MPYLQRATDNPFGAIPYGEVRSVRPYLKDASAVAIYPGDFVILETDGGVGVATTGSTTILGVAAEYSAASTRKVDFMVYDHPNQEFTLQDDGAVTAMDEATGPGLKANITVTTGDTTLLRSLHEIDSDTAATTSTLALSIKGLHPIEDGSYATTTGQQRKWVVTVNNHIFGYIGRTGI